MKMRLDNRAVTDNFFDDTRLLGIMAPMKDYLFCWQVNKMLQIDLRMNPDMEMKLIRKNREYFFPVFEYAEPTTCLVHYMYGNKCDGEYLLPEFKHLDYLWLLKGDWVSDESLQQLSQTLRSVAAVQLVVELPPAKIRNKEHLVF